MRRFLRWLLLTLAVVVVAVAGGAWWLLRASLPQLDGAVQLEGAAAPVTVERDARGTVTITGASRADVGYGLGVAHAQDRYFQMDLARRLAAGELSEVFGEAALAQDRNARLFRFRRVARRIVENFSPDERLVLDAYVRGVNDGLAGLRSRPWEYWLLGEVPRPWCDEDTVLVVHTMWWRLQHEDFAAENRRIAFNEALQASLGAAGAAQVMGFLFPAGTEWDAPIDAVRSADAIAAAAAIPGTDVIDLRTSSPPSTGHRLGTGKVRPAAAGSNNWALAGRLSASGAALVANDMHLSLDVPAIWYRARLRVTGEERELNGVTLAGTPVLVAGSNGRVAWGFTNSYGDWLDLRWTNCDAKAGTFLALDGQMQAFNVARERIRITGRPPERMEVRSGPEGVLFAQRRLASGIEQCQLATWLAAVPEATNLRSLQMERAASAAQAIALAPEVGIPQQNLVVGDSTGTIGWTILGRVPRTTGPLRAASTEFLGAAEQPRIVDPADGRVWTANARTVADAMERALSDDESASASGYDLGARAGQIRDGLRALQAGATPRDMLRVQLDDRAVFLARWQRLLLDVLDAPAVGDHARRNEFRQLVKDWTARADVDAVGYRLVRTYRATVERAVWDMVSGAVLNDQPEPLFPPPQFEGPLWQLVTTRPAHWLTPEHADWRKFLLAQVDATLTTLAADCKALPQCTWGERRPVAVRHPLSGALSFAAPLIDMPTLRLAGDHDMPRVQDGNFGASERFAVSPGYEADGYLQVAGGQSGHPLSPFFSAGFSDWAEGKPTPFLPGPTAHKLTISPLPSPDSATP